MKLTSFRVILTPPLVSRRKSPPNSSATVPPQLISVASLNYWRVRILKLGGLAPPINYAGNGCFLLTLSIASSWWCSCHLVWFWHYFSCYSLHTTHKVHPMWKKQQGKSFNSLPLLPYTHYTLQWRYSKRDGVSNHQPHHCSLNRLYRRRSTKISKLHVTGLCEGNSPITGEFSAQRASNAENVSIWWRHYERMRRQLV